MRFGGHLLKLSLLLLLIANSIFILNSNERRSYRRIRYVMAPRYHDDLIVNPFHAVASLCLVRSENVIDTVSISNLQCSVCYLSLLLDE